jgi:hypothetical protein
MEMDMEADKWIDAINFVGMDQMARSLPTWPIQQNYKLLHILSAIYT